ncbi:MAG: transglutaminase domain-containing protein [Oscillospiraceae bacterium]|nr:transglutaminase domain-containing protein [Oscillospiraceae bacterium]
MRKFTAWICFIILLLSLTGCGAKVVPLEPTEDSQAEASPEATTPEAPAEAPVTDQDAQEPAPQPAENDPAEEEPAPEESLPEDPAEVFVDVVKLQIAVPEQEVALLAEPPMPAVPDLLEPVASGELVADNGIVTIDYSNTEDGYIMIYYPGQTSKKLKVQITAGSTTYTYNLPKQEWTVFPLSIGNGTYQFKVFENISGNQYALIAAASHTVTLADEFAPFLRPNQYVNYSASSLAVEKARELTQGISAPLGKVEAIYNYVVSELTYDNYKASTVQSGYIPDLDTIMETKTGICFDYASLMTGMLRSQGIPCKMVFGYASGAYHAWISVWTEETGWVDGVIFFDGVAWQRLDPTFASSAGQSDQIMQYIGNGTNYSEKYFY